MEHLSIAWGGVVAWLKAHEETADLVTVWALVIAFFTLFIVDGIAFLVLQGQRSRTAVGVAIKGKKAAEALMFLAFTALWGAALALYYTFPDPIIGFWPRMGLRCAAVIGAYGSVYYGVRLILALSRERWGRPS